MPTSQESGGATPSVAERRALKAAQLGATAPPVDQPPLPCPRCNSSNTKFCYYNNYNFSQPRYFCKACRRYWTHGGALRDVPVGGGTRKSVKRPRPRSYKDTSSGSSPAFTPCSGTCSMSTSSSSTSDIISTASDNASVGPLFDHHSVPAVPLSGGIGDRFTGLLSLGGFGLGLRLDDVPGFGLLFPQHHDYMSGGGCGGGMNLNYSTSVSNGGDHGGDEGGYGDADQGLYGSGGGGGECFSSMAPELAISTTGNGV